jgi:hypothetical protein
MWRRAYQHAIYTASTRASYALPPAVLLQRLIAEVETRLDLSALEETRLQERDERGRLSALLDKSE